MKIHLAASSGSGPTALSAFDAALNDAGIANYNLLLLSSVIPPDTTIVKHPAAIPAGTLPGSWGDRLYVVMAEQRADVPGTEAWGGIGWVQDKVSGKGLFVEHEGTSEQKVRSDIDASLRQLMKTRGIDFGEIQSVVHGKACISDPVCAMVVAVFQASDWHNGAHLIGG